VCHHIIARCGGELTVETREGKGSMFRVALPLAPASPL
jgi:signal transduction histidine kinase